MGPEKCRAERKGRQRERLKGRRGWEGGEAPRGLQGLAHLLAGAPPQGEDEVGEQMGSPQGPGRGRGRRSSRSMRGFGKESGSWSRIRGTQ